MALIKRDVILFQTAKFGNEIHKELLAHDWDVYVANDLQQASDLLDKRTFKAGLCLIEEKCDNTQCLINSCTNAEQLTQLHRLFNLQARINWIMGVPTECTKRMAPDFSDIKPLAEYCYDYISLPVDIGRLLIALGNAYGMNEIHRTFKENMGDYPSSSGIFGNPSDLGLDRSYKAPMLQTLENARANADRELIITSMRHTNNNLSRAAETLGISRVNLYQLIEKYNITV